MIKIENVTVYGWEASIRGMRNPMNSWDKSDSYDAIDCEKCGRIDRDGICNPAEHKKDCENYKFYYIGKNDLKLMRTLAKAGNDHGKFARMINVTADIEANHTWWSEFDTYKVGTVRNSCSKMHKIHAKEFVVDDFDHEGIDEVSANGGTTNIVLNGVVGELEWLRNKFNETHEKMYWRAMIELLPMGYRLRATVQFNYQVLWSMYQARKNHKLDEWREFCKWCETLPYFKEIYLGE